jgi:small subunit ribosomal protein S24e
VGVGMAQTSAPADVLELLRPKNAKRLEVDMEGYEFYIVKDWYNPLIKRREIDLVVLHVGKSTPGRMQLRYKLAKALNVDIKRLFIRSVRTEYGVGRTKVEVHVYDSVERAYKFEPKHIIERNKIPEEEEEE